MVRTENQLNIFFFFFFLQNSVTSFPYQNPANKRICLQKMHWSSYSYFLFMKLQIMIQQKKNITQSDLTIRQHEMTSKFLHGIKNNKSKRQKKSQTKIQILNIMFVNWSVIFGYNKNNNTPDWYTELKNIGPIGFGCPDNGFSILSHLGLRSGRSSVWFWSLSAPDDLFGSPTFTRLSQYPIHSSSVYSFFTWPALDLSWNAEEMFGLLGVVVKFGGNGSISVWVKIRRTYFFLGDPGRSCAVLKVRVLPIIGT